MISRHRETDSDFSMEPSDKRAHRFVKLSPNLDTGAILQILALVFVGGAGYARIETNKTLTDARAAVIEKNVAEQERRTDTTLSELRADVKETGKTVNDLKSKIDLIDLKLSSQPRK